MELVKLFKEKINNIPVFLRRNVYKLALFSCLLNLTNCKHTVPKQEAQQEIKGIIEEFVSNRSFHLWIELSADDSLIIHQQTQNLLNRIERYEEATDTTVQLSEDAVMYAALLAESTILRKRLNDPNISQDRKDEYYKIETILNQCNVHVFDQEKYNIFLKFWDEYFWDNTAKWPPSPIVRQQK